MIVLDTNVISEAMRASADGRVVAWLDAQSIETLFITTITLAELRFGILSLPPGKRRDELQDKLQRRILPVFADRILSFDLAAATRYAELMTTARSRGRPSGEMTGTSPLSLGRTPSRWRRAILHRSRRRAYR